MHLPQGLHFSSGGSGGDSPENLARGVRGAAGRSLGAKTGHDPIITRLKHGRSSKRALIRTRRGEIGYGEHDRHGLAESMFSHEDTPLTGGWTSSWARLSPN